MDACPLCMKGEQPGKNTYCSAASSASFRRPV